MRGVVRTACADRVAAMLQLVLVGGLTADETPSPLTFRRVYVPEDSLNTQIRGLLPMKRAEFERRIELLHAAGRSIAVQAPARIEEAAFRARLSGQQLVDGTAELNIVKDGEEPVFLMLEPCNLMLESAAWTAPAPRPAVLGVDAAGQLRCVVEQSGTLQ